MRPPAPQDIRAVRGWVRRRRLVAGAVAMVFVALVMAWVSARARKLTDAALVLSDASPPLATAKAFIPARVQMDYAKLEGLVAPELVVRGGRSSFVTGFDAPPVRAPLILDAASVKVALVPPPQSSGQVNCVQVTVEYIVHPALPSATDRTSYRMKETYTLEFVRPRLKWLIKAVQTTSVPLGPP